MATSGIMSSGKGSETPDSESVTRAFNQMQALAMLGPGILANTMTYGVDQGVTGRFGGTIGTGEQDSADKAGAARSPEKTSTCNGDDKETVASTPGDGSTSPSGAEERAKQAGLAVLTRDEVVALLKELEGYKPPAKEVTKLGTKLAGEGVTKLTWQQAAAKITELNLPQDPFEKYGISETRFQEVLARYGDDPEVYTRADAIMAAMHAPECTTAAGSKRKRKEIPPDTVIKVHTHMIDTLRVCVQEFQNLPRKVRHQYTAKQCETTSELLVALAVEKKFGFNSEDVEHALVQWDAELHEKPEFQSMSQQLTGLMASLMSYAKPKLEADQFRVYLRELASQHRKMKDSTKELFGSYKGNKSSFLDCYRKFEALTQEIHESASQFEQISPQETREHYEVYKDAHPDIPKYWEESEQEVQTMMSMAAMHSMMGPPGAAGGMPPLSMPKIGKKQSKLKPNDVINMQEMIVQEQQQLIQTFSQTLRDTQGIVQWREQVVMGLVQGFASLAVEKKYHVSADDMAMAGFAYAAQLGTSERFMQCTMQQQQLLMSIPMLIQNPEEGCSIM